MADTVTPAQRSAIMSKVKGKDTKPEMALRKRLFSLGFRYRVHDDSLPGRPDIIFPKYNSVIFVHGCFWHSHGCRKRLIPDSNKEYWTKKITKNVQRDIENIQGLKERGWRVLIVWECSLRSSKIDKTIKRVTKWIGKQ
jgi:DNA mismatch endonuclease (patch repair protein)